MRVQMSIILTFESLPCGRHFQADEVWAIVPENLDKAHHQKGQQSIHKAVFEHFYSPLLSLLLFLSRSLFVTQNY